jgi:hypothetical protein
VTVTIVFGKTSDGYLHSYDSNYVNSRFGATADGVNGGAALYIGQNNNGGQYAVFEAFVGYDYSAIPAGDMVVAAEASLYVVNIWNTGITTDVEWRGYTWSTGGLLVSDWRTPTQLNAARLDGLTHYTSAAKSKRIQTSSDSLLNTVKTSTSIEHVVATSRMRGGQTPVSDEGVMLSSADEAGTAFDPALIYTSVTRHTLFGVLGAQVKVSDGWAYLESNGAAIATVTLKHRSTGGTVTTIASLPIGSGTNEFSPPYAAQSFALIATPGDHLLVLSRYGPTVNSLAILGFNRGGGVTWTPVQMRSTALPAYTQTMNQVAAAYHGTGGGTILAVVSHNGSSGDSLVHNELAHVAIHVSNILSNNTGASPIFFSDYSIPALQPIENIPGYFNSWHNQTGTGLDVATAAENNINGSNLWGYVYSYGTAANLGDNRALSEGRYVFAPAATSFTHTSTQKLNSWGRKDAGGKVRVVPVSATAAAFCSADSDAGYGIAVEIRNHSGATAGSVEIGHVSLSSEGITTMPDGPALGSVATWDAVYNVVDNKIWIYYVSSVNSREIRRTSMDLDTMQATREDVLVTTAAVGAVIHGIRTTRGNPVLQDSLITYSTINAGVLASVYYVDVMNASPNPPTLTPKANFDASNAQTFAWTFSDPNGDTQSAYQLEISNASTGVVALDTGKVLSATWSRNVAGSTLTNAVDYRWRVKTWDSQDSASDYSSYGVFSTSSGGTVTITNPAVDNPPYIITDDIPVTWSVSGTTQSAYRILLYRGATLVSDTGWIASAAVTATVAGMLSDQTHEIRIQVRNAALVVTNTAVRLVTPSYSTPEKPVITVQPEPEAGYVLVVIDNPPPGAPSAGIPEDDFESGVGTWQAGAGGSIAAEATTVHRGSGAVRLTATTGGVDPVFARDYGNFRAILPSTRYTARMWVWVNANTNVSGTIDWFDATYAYLSSSSFNVAVLASTWTQIQVTGTSPGTATLAVYGPSMTGAVPAGRYLILDEVAMGNASDRPDVASNSILRRVAGTLDAFEIIGEAEPDGTFRDYTATASINYEYVVRGNA